MRPHSHNRAFTLIELLMVITIIGLIAALAAPTLKNFRKGDATAAATQQLMGAVARARQLAISQRTTVYLVFVSTNFWNDPVIGMSTWNNADSIAATNLVEKVLTGYNFISLRTVGDQPGQNNARYLSTWQTLPESTMIDAEKFSQPRNSYYMIQTNPLSAGGYAIYGFDVATNIPFPLATTKPANGSYQYPALPCIGFDYLGRLISGRDEYLPIVQGAVTVPRDLNKNPMLMTPFKTNWIQETDNTNVYNVVHIDWLTGRARLESRAVQ